MASGPAQHAAFTLWSTGDEGVHIIVKGEAEKTSSESAESGPAKGESSAKDEETKPTSGMLAPIADKLNEVIGNRAVFTAIEKPIDARPADSCFKAGFGHLMGFLSAKGGIGILGDCGLDLLRLEAPNFDLGVGFRMDTGLSLGKKGARVVFVGIGGEVVLDEDTKKCCGVGAQFWLIKAKAVW